MSWLPIGKDHPGLDQFLKDPTQYFRSQSDIKSKIKSLAEEISSSKEIKQNVSSSLLNQVDKLDIKEDEKREIHFLSQKIFLKVLYSKDFISDEQIESIVSSCETGLLDKILHTIMISDHKSSYFKNITDIILSLSDHDKKDPEVIKALISFYTARHSSEDPITAALANVSNEKRGSIIKDAASFIEEKDDAKNIANILMACSLFDEKDPKEKQQFVKDAIFLFQITGESKFLHRDNNTQFVKNLASILKKFDHRVEQKSIYEIIMKDSSTNTLERIDKMAPLLYGCSITTTREIDQTLKMISQISTAEMKQLSTDGALLFERTKSSRDRATIALIISKIPSTERKEFIRELIPALEGIDIFHDLEQFLSHVHQIPLKKLKQLIEDTTLLTKDMSGNFRGIVLFQVSQWPLDDRKELINAALSIINKIYSRDGIFESFQIDYLTDLTNFSLVAPKFRKSALESCLREETITILDFINQTLSDPESREMASVHLLQTLETVISSQKKARELAEKIIRFEALQLREETPLFQKAVEVLIMTNPALSESKKNPYTLYNSLKQAEISEPLITTPLGVVKVGDLSFGFDPEGLRNAQKKLTFENLPKINPDFLANTLQAIEEKVRALPKEQQKDMIEDVNKVRKNIFSSFALIPGLLKMGNEGKEGDSISQRLFHLYTAIAYLQSKSRTAKEGQLLTEQEDDFLAFARFIENCQTGQSDGLAIYYEMVWHSGFMNEAAPKVDTSSYEAVKTFIVGPLQVAIRSAARDEKTLLKIVGLSSQLSHETLYLLNRLYKQLGLEHTLTFDFNSGVISDVIINKDTIELVDSVFNEIPFSEAISIIKGNINQTLQANKPVVTLTQLFEVLQTVKNLPANWRDSFFTFEEDEVTPNGITDLGAAYLILAVNLGKVVS